MRSIGCVIEDAPEATFNGIAIIPGPEIVVKPSFAVCPAEYKCRFPEPSKIKISGRSSLVVSGNLVIESLDLDGALVIECEEGATGTISELVVKNEGWKKIVEDANHSPEYIRIRGYKMKKEETKVIVFKKDGSVSGYVPPQSSEQVSAQVSSSFVAPDTPKPESREEANNLASPSLRQSLAIDSDLGHERNLNLHEPRTPEATVKNAECCVIS
jgi:hypothetical protein